MDNAVLKKKKYKAEIIELKSSNKKNELEIVEKEEIEQERFDQLEEENLKLLEE